MRSVVLDSSALLASLLNEPGKETVDPVIDEATISAANLAGVVGYYARNGTPPGSIRQALDCLKVEVAPLDAALAFDAGMMPSLTRTAGLSLGDRICLALARRRGVPALTSDRKWALVAADLGVKVELIR